MLHSSVEENINGGHFHNEKLHNSQDNGEKFPVLHTSVEESINGGKFHNKRHQNGERFQLVENSEEIQNGGHFQGGKFHNKRHYQRPENGERFPLVDDPEKNQDGGHFQGGKFQNKRHQRPESGERFPLVDNPEENQDGGHFHRVRIFNQRPNRTPAVGGAQEIPDGGQQFHNKRHQRPGKFPLLNPAEEPQNGGGHSYALFPDDSGHFLDGGHFPTTGGGPPLHEEGVEYLEDPGSLDIIEYEDDSNGHNGHNVKRPLRNNGNGRRHVGIGGGDPHGPSGGLRQRPIHGSGGLNRGPLVSDLAAPIHFDGSDYVDGSGPELTGRPQRPRRGSGGGGGGGRRHLQDSGPPPIFKIRIGNRPGGLLNLFS